MSRGAKDSYVLAFGSQKYCRTDDLFSDYEISDSLYFLALFLFIAVQAAIKDSRN